MNYTLDKSIEIDQKLLYDTFHNPFYFTEVQSSTTTLSMLNNFKEKNPMIIRAKTFGYIIIFSKSSNKYYLFYSNPSFLDRYREMMSFKTKIDSETDEFSTEKFNKYLALFNNAPFNKISNKIPNKQKCINLLDFPNDYVINYSHDMRLPERITTNPLLNSINSDTAVYYNYIINKDGLIIGKVIDSLENGVVHQLLVNSPQDEVYIAGEIKIENNKLVFNFLSGVYSAPQKTTTDPFLTYYLDILVTKIFKMHNMGTAPLESIRFDYHNILPRKPFDKTEIEFFCSKFNNKIVKVPDGNRCIDNTYSNLLPSIQSEINRRFATISEVICNDIDKLFPARVQPVVVDPSKKLTIFELIESELTQFGLSIKLGTFEQLKAQFKTLLQAPDRFATFKDGVIVDEAKTPSLEFNRIKSDGSVERKIFTFKKKLSSGSFNKTEIYIDKTDPDYKEYILRSSISVSEKEQYESFYENLKHFVLYILVRKYIGNVKFIPKPYHFGLKKNTNGTVTIYMIMEKGMMTLSEYCGDTKINLLDIRKILFSIYVDLNELENKIKISFKHNDFKCNNIVVTDKGSPLIIDFGLSEFNITDGTTVINFVPAVNDPGTTYYKSNYKFNIIHDMLHLITSFNFVHRSGFNAYQIFNFVNNQRSNILDGQVTYEMLEKLYRFPRDHDIFRHFYGPSGFNLTSSSVNSFLITRGITIYIEPAVLAHNLGLSPADLITDKFEKKYLKYRNKYLALKSLHNL